LWGALCAAQALFAGGSVFQPLSQGLGMVVSGLEHNVRVAFVADCSCLSIVHEVSGCLASACPSREPLSALAAIRSIAATMQMNKVEKEEHIWAAFQHFDKDGSG